MKNVLITGGAGFIGSALALKLISKGHSIVVLDNLTPQVHGNNAENSYTFNLIKDKVKFIKGDVSRSEDWDASLDGIDTIVHLAAQTGTGQSMYQVTQYVDVNTAGTALMLDKLVNNNHSVTQLIVASSRAVYGEGKYECAEHGAVYPGSRTVSDMENGDFDVKCPLCNKTARLLKTDETSLSHPASVYGYTKKTQEELSILVGNSIGLPVIAYRFQNVYGPGQSLKNPYTGILSVFSTQIKNNDSINIFEDGKASRDFVCIDDAVSAVILGMENEKVGTQVFNVGSGVGTDVLTVAKTLKEKYKSDVELNISGNFRLGDIRSNIADNSKIEQMLGYKPTTDFEKGISAFVDWVETQDIEENLYAKSIDEIKSKGLYK